MNATFTYKGIEYSAFWNERVYGAAQKRYVEITTDHSRYGSGTKMEYTEVDGWVKNGGMPYAQMVAVALGFLPAPKKEVVLSFGKYAGSKLAELPVSYLKWLVSHKNVLKAENQHVVEDVKAFL